MWKIGAIEITPVIELEIAGGTRFILPQATREEVLKIGWLQPHFADPDGRLKMAVQSFLVKTPTQHIIVDTGLGNDKQGRGVPRWNNLQTPFLEDLASHGFAPDAIDAVICTHLHVDHIGWNTRLVDGAGCRHSRMPATSGAARNTSTGTRTGTGPTSRRIMRIRSSRSSMRAASISSRATTDSAMKFASFPRPGTVPRI